MPRYDLGDCNLPKLLKARGVKNRDFAGKMKMSRQQASRTINGKTKMDSPMLLSVCLTYGIDPMKVYDLIPIKEED